MTKDRIIEMYVNCTMFSESCRHCPEYEKEDCHAFFYRTETLSRLREHTLKDVLQLCVKGGILET